MQASFQLNTGKYFSAEFGNQDIEAVADAA